MIVDDISKHLVEAKRDDAQGYIQKLRLPSEMHRRVLQDIFAHFKVGNAERLQTHRRQAFEAFQRSPDKRDEVDVTSYEFSVFDFPSDLVIGEEAITKLNAGRKLISQLLLAKKPQRLWCIFMENYDIFDFLFLLEGYSGYESHSGLIQLCKNVNETVITHCVKAAKKLRDEFPPIKDTKAAFALLATLQAHANEFSEADPDSADIVDNLAPAGFCAKDEGLCEVLGYLMEEIWNETDLKKITLKQEAALKVYIDCRAGKYDSIKLDARTPGVSLFDLDEKDVKPEKRELFDAAKFYLARALRDGDPFYVLFVNGFFDKVPRVDLDFILAIIGRDASSGDNLWMELEERCFTRILQ